MTDDDPSRIPPEDFRPPLGELSKQRQFYTRRERLTRQRPRADRLLEIVCADERRLLGFVEPVNDRVVRLLTVAGMTRRYFIGPDQELAEVTPIESAASGQSLLATEPFSPSDVVFLCGRRPEAKRAHVLPWAVLYDEVVKAKQRGRRRTLRLGHDTPIVGAS